MSDEKPLAQFTPAAVEQAAYALAGLVPVGRHSSDCPVWTWRKDAFPVRGCVCWVITHSRSQAQAVTTVLAPHAVGAAVQTIYRLARMFDEIARTPDLTVEETAFAQWADAHLRDEAHRLENGELRVPATEIVEAFHATHPQP